MNLNAGALREAPVGLWGNESWEKMNAVATRFPDANTAETPRIEYKPLPSGAKRIVDKPIAAVGGAALGRATLAHNNNLATDRRR